MAAGDAGHAVGLGKAMIVAGIGCKSGIEAETVVEAIDAALAAFSLQRADLGLLATGDIKRDEPGLSSAAGLLNLPLLILDHARLSAAAPKCLTSSQASLAASGLPSVSEAAALVAAGPEGRLLGPRIALDGVTCALGITAWSAVAGGAAA